MYLLVKFYFSNTLACFAATVVIVFCARLFAVWRKVPSNVFMISGIFPIVPGIGIYNTIYDIMIGDAAAAMSSGLETFKAVAAIVLGIVCVFVSEPVVVTVLSANDACALNIVEVKCTVLMG